MALAFCWESAARLPNRMLAKASAASNAAQEKLQPSKGAKVKSWKICENRHKTAIPAILGATEKKPNQWVGAC